MPVKSHEKPSKAEEAEVSNCVSNLIQAFTNGLNVFKRLRERRKKRKAKKESQVVDPTISAEVQLSKSLRRGPQELAQRYDECFSQRGHSFAKGDAIAHASLAETLIKLNTGLVTIIASFLNHDQKNTKSPLHLDYKSLTNLSDNSRQEALQSMTQLYMRLSQSQLQLQHMKSSCPRCGTSEHIDCSQRSSTSSSSSSTDKEKKRRTSSSSKQRHIGPTITRMPLKSSSHNNPQLVVIRPKPSTGRKNSTSSSSSSKSSSPVTSAYTSPLSSPLPLYIAESPFELDSAPAQPLSGQGRRRKDSFNVDARPDTWPQHHAYPTFAPEHLHLPTPKLPTFVPTQRKPPSPPQHSSTQNPSSSSKSPPPASPPSTPRTPKSPSSPPIIKRRMDKQTLSSYTFASDSTKLGEIPQRNWTVPWDYEEAERLNAVAAREAAEVAAARMRSGDVVGKKGLFRWMKKERVIA